MTERDADAADVRPPEDPGHRRQHAPLDAAPELFDEPGDPDAV